MFKEENKRMEEKVKLEGVSKGRKESNRSEERKEK